MLKEMCNCTKCKANKTVVTKWYNYFKESNNIRNAKMLAYVLGAK